MFAQNWGKFAVLTRKMCEDNWCLLHNKALDDRLPLVVDGQIPILDNNHIVDAINNINQAHAIRQRLIQRF
jgi:hypothetical protein